MDALARYQVATMKIDRSRCPANMFANSRIARVNGWMMTYLRISIGISSGMMNSGACGTHDLKYPMNPLVLNPWYQYRTYMITTSGITNPIRAIAGNWMIGISFIRFISTMKKNIDAMYPRYLSPFLPSCGRTIWSRTARM